MSPEVSGLAELCLALPVINQDAEAPADGAADNYSVKAAREALADQVAQGAEEAECLGGAEDWAAKR